MAAALIQRSDFAEDGDDILAALQVDKTNAEETNLPAGDEDETLSSISQATAVAAPQVQKRLLDNVTRYQARHMKFHNSIAMPAISCNVLHILECPGPHARSASIPGSTTGSWIDVTLASVSPASAGFTWLISNQEQPFRSSLHRVYFPATRNPERVLTN